MADSGLDATKARLFVLRICLQYGSLIRKIICRYLKNTCAADDAFQEVLLQLLLRPMPADEKHIKSHIYRTTVNCATISRRQTICYEKHLTKQAENADIVESQEDPRTALINVEQTTETFNLIRKHLSPKEYLAISLHYRNGHDIHKIAQIMNLKAASVSHYIARGIKRLRGALILKEVLAAIG
jgi:RNA polymerase sigma factor (sigma-70 family)